MRSQEVRKIQFKSKILLYAGIGYVVAVLTSSFLPEFLSLLLPLAGAGIGAMLTRNPRTNLPAEVLPVGQQTASVASPPVASAPPLNTAADDAIPGHTNNGSRSEAEVKIGPEFAPVVEYLSILEDMIISEGQKDTLDNEIVEKSLALFARLQRVIPLLQELNNGEINHTVRRLIMKDLNGVINPFLRLSGEAKTKNRRMLLNGLRDVDSKISEIASTIEHKDLMELQTKAELIHQRYSSSEL